MSRPTKVLILIATFLAGTYAWRKGIDWLKREPRVPPKLVERQWLPHVLGPGYTFDVPWPLQKRQLSFPSEAAQSASSSTVFAHEADGLEIMAMHVSLRSGSGNLESAAESWLAGFRSVPGTLSVSGKKTQRVLFGLPAFDVEARIERQRGEPLQLYGVIFGQGPDLYQIQFGGAADQPEAYVAWKRLRQSLRRASGA